MLHVWSVHMVTRGSHGAIVLEQLGGKRRERNTESVRTLQDFGLPHVQETAFFSSV